MSLHLDFFINRGNIQDQFTSKGRIELDTFMEEFSLSKEDLFKANIIKEKEIWTTTDLYDFELTQKGKKFFIYNSNQIFLIRAGIKSEKVYQFILNN